MKFVSVDVHCSQELHSLIIVCQKLSSFLIYKVNKCLDEDNSDAPF